MVFYCKVFEIARFFFLLREQFGWFSMNLGSEPNPDSGCGQVVEGFGSFYSSYLSIEQCPCGAEVETALCEACLIWKDRTFAWASPGDVGSSHLC